MPTEIRFNNAGGATVTVDRWLITYRWTCHGCTHHGPMTVSRRGAAKTANTHAGECRALPR
jgi:hypothetical protein